MRKFILIILLGAVFCCSVSGVPRYSLDYNQSCVLCHVDPSGGGVRSLYGAQFFAYTELAMKGLSFDEIDNVKPMLNDQIQIGFDSRTMFFGTDQPAINTFFQMQGDLYAVFQLSPQWTFYLDKGIYEGFNIFGIGHILPFNGYVKAGHFTPPYGLRLEDHKAFVREKLGFAYGWAESGMEIGFHPQRFTLALAVTNGTSAKFDSDEAKALTGRVDYRIHIDDLRLWIGATGRYNEVNGSEDKIVGGYGGFSIGKFTLLGEIDYRDHTSTELVTFVEASLRLRQGLTLKVEHDFHDPDLDLESGAENMYLGGLEIVPTGFLELIPNVRYHDLESTTAEDYIEAEIQFHIFF